MKNWYADLTKKQRVIMWVATLLVSAIPVIGWFFIAPWAIPLMLYLEFQHESVNKKRNIDNKQRKVTTENLAEDDDIFESMSVYEIIEYMQKSSNSFEARNIPSITKRLYRIALYEHNIEQEEREFAAKLLSAVKQDAEKSLSSEALLSYKKANKFMEENALKHGVGSLAWILEEEQVSTEMTIPFIAREEYKHLLEDFLSLLEPNLALQVKQGIANYLEAKNQAVERKTE